MDLTAYLLSRAVWATTPAGETVTEAQARAEAIAAMLRAYAPGDGVEAMMACQCIMMQFVLDAAMRDAGNAREEPAAQGKARAGAISASRTLHQWVTKLENYRKRNERRAAEAAKAPAAIPAADPPEETSPGDTGQQQVASPPPASPEPDALVASSLDPPIAAAVRSAAPGVGFAGARNGRLPSLPVRSPRVGLTA